MAHEAHPIKVPPDSELARSLREAEQQGRSLTLEIGDTLFDVSVERSMNHEDESVAEDRAERSRAGIRKSLGVWQAAGVDAAAFKQYIRERRHTANRPSVRW